MPAAYTPQQKSAIAQYVSFTSVKDSVAAKALKAAGWNINVAIDQHFAKAGKTAPAPSQAPSIENVFNQYRDATDTNDTMGTEGTMKYLGDIGVNLDEPLMVAVLSVVGAETIGELDRSKFVEGWQAHSSAVNSVSTMHTAAQHMRAQLRTDPAFFKTVYKHTFLFARAPGQKSANLEMAIEFWRLLLGDKGLDWRTRNVDWVELWSTFLQEKWDKSVSKDMWNQLEVFARKTKEDELMSFWSEESSWPTVIDEFVAYAKDKNGNKMQVE